MEGSLLEMLPGEIAERAKDPSAVAIVPLGSVEQHGPHLLLGCDTYSVLGRCVAIARETGGMVFPLVPFTWVGCTNYYSGGGGVRESVAISYIRAVVRGIWQAGWRRILIVNGHGGNFYAMRQLPRDLLEEDGIPVMVIYGDAKCPELRDKGVRHSEASGMTGGLRMLGREDLIDDVAHYTKDAVKEFGDGSEAVIWPKPYIDARKLGVIGQDYLDEIRHVSPTMDYDPDRGIESHSAVARHIAKLIDEFATLVDEMESDGRLSVGQD